MAKAYACDRCGGLFKESDYSLKIPVILESDQESHIYFQNISAYISLCPKCRAGFQKWWDEDAAHKTTEYLHKCTLYEVPEEEDE